MNVDGSGLLRLTDGGWEDNRPVWSPDGNRLAFESKRTDWEIRLVNADGSGLTNLTNNPANEGLARLAWSPDGRYIAFFRRVDDKSEIYVVNADGSGQTRLADNPGGTRSPAWSPAP